MAAKRNSLWLGLCGHVVLTCHFGNRYCTAYVRYSHHFYLRMGWQVIEQLQIVRQQYRPWPSRDAQVEETMCRFSRTSTIGGSLAYSIQTNHHSGRIPEPVVFDASARPA